MSRDAVLIHICESCGPSDRTALIAAIEAAGFPVPVRIKEQACMNGCARPVSLAVQSRGRATCFFAGVDPHSDAADIVATVGAYVAAPAGWITDARPCGRLRHCLVGRVPAL